MANRSTVISNITNKVTAPPAQFLTTLSNWMHTPAHQFMWLVSFKLNTAKYHTRHFPIVLDHKIRGRGTADLAVRQLEHAPRFDDWHMEEDSSTFSLDRNFVHAAGELNGCMLIQGVNLPGEQIGHQYVGVQDRGGILPILYGNERLEPQEMTMSVYEGNISFIDTIIRPWIVLAGHLGQVARGRDDPKNIKCDITVTQFAKTVGREVTHDIAGLYVPDASPWWQKDALGRTKGGVVPTNTKLIPIEGEDRTKSGLIARKQMHFFNACPVRMEASDLTYADDGGVLTKNVTWAYTHYTIHNLTGDTIAPQGNETSILLDSYYEDGIRAHWSMINALYQEKFTDLGSKFPLGAKWKRPSTNVYDKIPSNTMGMDNSLTIKELKERWLKNTMRHAANAGIDGAPGARGILLYGPQGEGYSESFGTPGASFKVRWSKVQAANLCKGARDPKMPGGFKNVCKPPPPPPGSALDRIRGALRNLGKLARNARGLAASFKRVGKAKGVRGKLGALGDLNKSFKTLGGGDRSGKGPAKRKDGTPLGGGMPKAKSPGKTTTGISGALGVVDDAKKAARAITGKSRTKGGH